MKKDNFFVLGISLIGNQRFTGSELPDGYVGNITLIRNDNDEIEFSKVDNFYEDKVIKFDSTDEARQFLSKQNLYIEQGTGNFVNYRTWPSILFKYVGLDNADGWKFIIRKVTIETNLEDGLSPHQYISNSQQNSTSPISLDENKSAINQLFSNYDDTTTMICLGSQEEIPNVKAKIRRTEQCTNADGSKGYYVPKI